MQRGGALALLQLPEARAPTTQLLYLMRLGTYSTLLMNETPKAVHDGPSSALFVGNLELVVAEFSIKKFLSRGTVKDDGAGFSRDLQSLKKGIESRTTEFNLMERKKNRKRFWCVLHGLMEDSIDVLAPDQLKGSGELENGFGSRDLTK